nr:glycosyltransferase family A protein [Jiella sp. LLJ827]
MCVPTCNRARFLEYLFTHLAEVSPSFGFSYEIVISDNASTDDTGEVVARFKSAGMPIRYYRQAEQVHVLNNVLSAYRRGRGRYVLYIADDDLLHPEGFVDAMNYMLANPDILACYSPWQSWDEVRKEPQGLFYRLKDDVTVFRPGQDVDLLKMIVEGHVFPEIAIYRADALRSLLTTPSFCYWAFPYLTTIAAQGPVAFRRAPFYRSVTATPVAPQRLQDGTEQALIGWDLYRGGLEYMIYTLLRRHGVTPDETVRQSFRNMVDMFVEARMQVALRLWLARKDYLKAHDLIARLHYLSPQAAAKIDPNNTLRPLLVAQTLARHANGVADISHLMVAGVPEAEAVGKLIRDLGLCERISILADEDARQGVDRERTLVFLGQERLRPDYLAAGFEPGLIVSERDIGLNYLV